MDGSTPAVRCLCSQLFWAARAIVTSGLSCAFALVRAWGLSLFCFPFLSSFSYLSPVVWCALSTLFHGHGSISVCVTVLPAGCGCVLHLWVGGDYGGPERDAARRVPFWLGSLARASSPQRNGCMLWWELHAGGLWWGPFRFLLLPVWALPGRSCLGSAAFFPCSPLPPKTSSPDKGARYINSPSPLVFDCLLGVLLFLLPLPLCALALAQSCSP